MTQLHVSTLSTKKEKSSKIFSDYVYKGRVFIAAFCVLGLIVSWVLPKVNTRSQSSGSFDLQLPGC